ncbi:hypothetical protein GCK72_007957 [Caenorhabditis remanei]|uniref:DUF38 domain-containing protein n=1 Tax=Caenorhabditis remanei TaxID=31234 RepID=A0A6A5HMW0_CAERE|nr:hypothetical protein GCK72_007957 [Caenorhabditis remanei]KAF1767996.1 hypothetical protein GCK72_007957 [Caenorhabditis remanei]
MKKLIFNLFGGRSNLHVNRLDYDIDYIPEFLTSSADLKLRVNFLNPTDHQCFEAALPLLDPDSFPLKTLRTTVTGRVTHEHPVLMSAETLILLIDPPHTTIQMNDIKKLSNKTLIVDSCYNSTLRFHMFGLVKYLKTGQKPIGTTYIFLACGDNVKNLLFIMEMAFKNFKNPLNDVQERFIADAPRFSIPINTDSRILAYGRRDRENVKDRWSLVVKVVPASK